MNLTFMQRHRIKSYFIIKPEVTGVTILEDRVQVKLKSGAPRPHIATMEGVPVEYVYEDMRPV